MRSLDDRSWTTLIDRIRAKSCTPFIGAGISPHPKAAEIAREWANTEGYPLEDRHDLARVAQFIGVQFDPVRPKELLLDRFRQTPPPNFDDAMEPHRLLADLRLPLYITTNYDPFMFQALSRDDRKPLRVTCRWNESMEKRKAPPKPDAANPWVFHLHGNDEDPYSMVLTEGDYLDFLVRLQSDDKMLPAPVQLAIANTVLIFMGYSLADWTFRVLFRAIRKITAAQRAHVAVQLPRPEPEVAYLESYLKDMLGRAAVFWGTAEEFARELRQRWDTRNEQLSSG